MLRLAYCLFWILQCSTPIIGVGSVKLFSCTHILHILPILCPYFVVPFSRYIAICHPMRAQTVCTVSRAKRIIAGVWALTCVYCLLWFFLVDIQVNADQRVQCGYRVSRDLYLPIYLIDFTIFYVLPLLLAIVLYALIARILYLGPVPRPADSEAHAATTLRRSCKEPAEGGAKAGRHRSALSSRKQVRPCALGKSVPVREKRVPRNASIG